ncbi:hypothetical protein LCGC14_0823430 [marine sediment metagenome]|uniref:Uncharacterized protein n=1 Tax=marine sediment metagenome TaxID=412755 RepID=A0A0F9PI14_9ZZZZ
MSSKKTRKPTPAPWRVSDAHGLCIVRDVPDGVLVADLDPDGAAAGWKGRRADAELIVKQRNGWDKLVRERDDLRRQVKRLSGEAVAVLQDRVAELEQAMSEVVNFLMRLDEATDEDCDCTACQETDEPKPTH